MRNALTVVPAELRSPVLPFVPSIHTRTLPLMRPEGDLMWGKRRDMIVR
jgi:hypothetical protein